ncbi:MAG TPA: gephyrin-like molybdotransferase Glp [Acidimicrobiales bacterium]|nr:gephyrin-like molybdotransferase Glp [Acidimicrobiales bacterium]
MIPLDEARGVVLAGCFRLPAERVPVDEALGLITSEAVVSAQAVPPFANTAMDGFAVRAADTAETPATLTVVGTVAAGSRDLVPVGQGEAVRIMTGAPIPPGADAVVMVERTQMTEDGGTVVVLQAASAGDHVRAPGEDVAVGQEVFPAGTELSPGHLGVLASIGVFDVSVFRRPRVGVLSTGDELVDDDRPLQPGQIRDSNRHTLLALVAQAGCTPVDLGVAPDDEAAITDAIERGLSQADALLTSGGVSVGDFDYVKVVLDKLSGGSMRWMQVAVKPAKPLAFGTVGGKPVFGLPGNPVSSMVSFELFARPGLRTLMGHPTPLRPAVRAVADEPLTRRPDGKVHFVRVRAVMGDDGRYHVRSSGGQASNLLRSMALANGLAVLPDGKGVAAAGEVDLLTLP